MKVYAVQSLHSDKKYVSYTLTYPSQILHSYVKKYLTFIKNNKHFNPIFNVIDLNDVYVKVLFESDDMNEINNFINTMPNNDVDNNVIHKLEQVNIVKSPDVQANINYHKEYYEKNKDKYVKTEEEQREYYDANKKVLKEKSKKYYRDKQARGRSKHSMSIENFIY